VGVWQRSIEDGWRLFKMRLQWELCCISCLFYLVAFLSFGFCRQSPVYMNQFAVHIPSGREAADEVARKHGFRNLGQVRWCFQCFLFKKRKVMASTVIIWILIFSSYYGGILELKPKLPKCGVSLCLCVAWYSYSDLPWYEKLLVYKSAVVNQLSLCPEGSVIRVETIYSLSVCIGLWIDVNYLIYTFMNTCHWMKWTFWYR